MYGDFINELKHPNLLKPFDEIFEFQLPLRNAKLKFHSKVKKRQNIKTVLFLSEKQLFPFDFVVLLVEILLEREVKKKMVFVSQKKK